MELRCVLFRSIRSSGVFFSSHLVRGLELFGAKIIPNRAAWLEFEVEPSGAIYVKIDRRRKVSATTLLRAFGLEEAQILKIFKAVDTNPDTKYITETLKHDTARDQASALLEVYKRIRPGDLATVDNAKSLIENMFFNFDRYDLSKVGRWKTEQRLAQAYEFLGKKPNSKKSVEYTAEDRVLKVDDVVAVITEVIRMNNDFEAVSDDIDHLGNRRIRSVGEMLQNHLRVGLTRMERIIKDRMSTLD